MILDHIYDIMVNDGDKVILLGLSFICFSDQQYLSFLLICPEKPGGSNGENI
jgi:hypothetical protein